jgi:hypothetical protein
MIAAASGEVGAPSIAPEISCRGEVMAARETPAKEWKPGKLLRDALLISLNRETEGMKTKRLQMVADALVDAAIKGELPALREIFDRIDGKVTQAPAGSEEKGPVELRIRWLTAADKVPRS